MSLTVATYGMGVKVPFSYDQAVEKVKDALKVEGFGVLWEIDVKATMKAKIDVDRTPYIILGACNPHLAHQALTAEPDIGLLLPCNVVVFEDGADVWVKAIDPDAMVQVTRNPGIESMAKQAREKLTRALESLVS